MPPHLVCGRYQRTNRRLGRGQYGTVYEGVDTQTTKAVAIKRIVWKNWLQKQQGTDLASIVKQVDKEVECQRGIDHPNVLKLLAKEFQDDKAYIVLERCFSSLDVLLADYKCTAKRMPEDQAQRFFLQIVNGLGALRNANVVHRDLKPANFLLDSKDERKANLKIGDFGFARKVQQNDLAATICGSPFYMAPEVWDKSGYDTKADIWSVGVILFEMLHGSVPFTGTSAEEVVRKMRSGRVAIGSGSVVLSSDCKDLIMKLLTPDPVQRCDWAQLVMHPWVNLPDLTNSMRVTDGNGLPPVAANESEGTASSSDQDPPQGSVPDSREESAGQPIADHGPTHENGSTEQDVEDASSNTVDHEMAHKDQPKKAGDRLTDNISSERNSVDASPPSDSQIRKPTIAPFKSMHGSQASHAGLEEHAEIRAGSSQLHSMKGCNENKVQPGESAVEDAFELVEGVEFGGNSLLQVDSSANVAVAGRKTSSDSRVAMQQAEHLCNATREVVQKADKKCNSGDAVTAMALCMWSSSLLLSCARKLQMCADGCSSDREKRSIASTLDCVVDLFHSDLRHAEIAKGVWQEQADLSSSNMHAQAPMAQRVIWHIALEDCRGVLKRGAVRGLEGGGPRILQSCASLLIALYCDPSSSQSDKQHLQAFLAKIVAMLGSTAESQAIEKACQSIVSGWSTLSVHS